MNTRMTGIFKNVLSLALALALCVALAAPAFASGGSINKGLTWTLDGTTLTISGKGALPDYSDANMPPWYKYADSITALRVEKGVTAIGALAFYGCSALTSVSLPDTLTAIGDRAFKDCVALDYVALPAGLRSIGIAAFENCAALTAVVLPEGLTDIGDMAFYRCASLLSVTVPSSLEHMGMVVFAWCTSLIRAEIRCPLTKLPDWTFHGCTNLVSLALPDELTEVGDSAFTDCDSLADVHYKGDSSAALETRISEETDFTARGGVTSESISSTAGAYTASDTYVTVTESVHAVITVERSVISGVVQVLGSVTAVINDVVGWPELRDVIGDMLLERTRTGTSGTVRVKVSLPDSTLDGASMALLAGESVDMTITTGSGSVWRIDLSSLSRTDFEDKTYSLAVSVSEESKRPEGLNCSRLFRLNLSEEIPFRATVSVPLGTDCARRFASFFYEDHKELELLRSVEIDNVGTAWFSTADAVGALTLLVALDAESVSAKDATVPETLYSDYGAADADGVSTLTDAKGNYYRVGERTSRWGITGGQFMVYVVLAVVVVVAVVSAVMLYLNRARRAKEKYARMAERDQAARRKAEQEDALYQEVLREMLGENEKKSGN